jgi:hypothetical protein
VTTQVILILVGIVGVIVVFGVLTQLIEGAGRGFRELAAHYPAQGAAPDATRGEAKVYFGTSIEDFQAAPGCLWIFMPWTWWRGARQVRYAVDDEYLHLETEGGRLVPRAAMSIPWGAVEDEGPAGRHMGEHTILHIGDSIVLFPSVAIERELELRAAADAGMREEDEPDQRGVDWTEDL